MCSATHGCIGFAHPYSRCAQRVKEFPSHFELQPPPPWWPTDVGWCAEAALCMISRLGCWPDLGNKFCCGSILGSWQLISVLNLATLTQICLLSVEVHGNGGNWLGILQLPDHLILGGLKCSTAALFYYTRWVAMGTVPALILSSIFGGSYRHLRIQCTLSPQRPRHPGAHI